MRKIYDEQKAKELITTQISASELEVSEAMEGIVTPFQKNERSQQAYK